MPPERPVRLTFPSREPGARRIMAGKLQVGVCLQMHTRKWRAYLWARPGIVGSAIEIKGNTVAQIREQVREKLATEGPWWVMGEEERSDEEAG